MKAYPVAVLLSTLFLAKAHAGDYTHCRASAPGSDQTAFTVLIDWGKKAEAPDTPSGKTSYEALVTFAGGRNGKFPAVFHSSEYSTRCGVEQWSSARIEGVAKIDFRTVKWSSCGPTGEWARVYLDADVNPVGYGMQCERGSEP